MIRPLAALGLAAVGFTACDRPQSPAPVSSSNSIPASPPRAASRPGEVPNSSPDLSTLHWLGKKRLAADTNSTTVMAIWNLPETARLGAQTLDKLALAPWRLLKNDAATNGAPIALLRPLLDDLVAEESRLVIHHPTNAPAAWSLAIKLPADRAQLWRTNLATVLESLTGAKVTPASDSFSWTIPAPTRLGSESGEASNIVSATISFRRTNDWTVVQLGTRNSEHETKLLDSALHTPHSALTPWLSLSLDLPALNRAFALGWSLPANCPRASFTFAGAGAVVQTRGTFSFEKPLDLPLEPWNVPTNLLQEPLVSFTAVRGLRPWLASLAVTREFGLTNLPNQCFQWGLGGAPFFTYFAAPWADASNQIARISDRLVADLSFRILQRNGFGKFDKLPGGSGVGWSGLPYLSPRLYAISQPGGDFLRLGFFPPTTAQRPVPPELLFSLTARTNLLAYDWEMTGPRIEGLTGLIQILRVGAGYARISPYSAGMTWLRAAKTNLANCTTGVLMDQPSVLAVSRTSTLGLTALELELLVDWLESPAFPSGLHTLLAPPGLKPLNPLPESGVTTNSPIPPQ